MDNNLDENAQSNNNKIKNLNSNNSTNSINSINSINSTNSSNNNSNYFDDNFENILDNLSLNDNPKLLLLEKILKENNCYFKNASDFIKICEWCRSNIFNFENGKEKEKKWGNNILKKEKITSQWTTLLGENMVCDVLKLLGHKNINKITKKNDAGKKIIPDIETDSGIYEVKTRNWNTTGTAGEKVFGVPFKYSSVPRIYGKPLYIVLVAAQELKDNTIEIFTTPTPEKHKIIKFYESINIHFMRFTDLLDILDKKIDKLLSLN